MRGHAPFCVLDKSSQLARHVMDTTFEGVSTRAFMLQYECSAETRALLGALCDNERGDYRVARMETLSILTNAFLLHRAQRVNGETDPSHQPLSVVDAVLWFYRSASFTGIDTRDPRWESAVLMIALVARDFLDAHAELYF